LAQRTIAVIAAMSAFGSWRLSAGFQPVSAFYPKLTFRPTDCRLQKDVRMSPAVGEEKGLWIGMTLPKGAAGPTQSPDTL
jgi:hypothetical protein